MGLVKAGGEGVAGGDVAPVGGLVGPEDVKEEWEGARPAGRE